MPNGKREIGRRIMETNEPQSAASTSDLPAAVAPRSPIRVWPAVLLLALFWGFHVAGYWLEMSMFFRFISRMAAHAALLLGFLIWWFTNRRLSWYDCWFGVGVTVATGVVAGLIADKTVSPFGLVLSGLPYVFTVWTAWLLVARSYSPNVQRWGLCAVIALAWGYCDLVRWDGLDGAQNSKLSWRWTPTKEELFLAEVRTPVQDTPGADGKYQDSAGIVVGPGDWPEFRGPQRDN